MSSEHDSLIKTPRQLITVVILAFVVPIIVIVLLVTFVTSTPRTGVGTFSMSPEAVEARIRPVAGFEFRDPSAPELAAPASAAAPAPQPPTQVAQVASGAAATAPAAGKATYEKGCNACHAAGVAGAPKTGDTKAAWGNRLAQGIDGLTASVIKGKGAMPARGAVATASDAELRAAVEYMVSTLK